MKRVLLIGFIFLFLLGALAYFNRDKLIVYYFEPTPSSFEKRKLSDFGEDADVIPPTVVVENLEIPWELVFLPDGDMLITERAGRLVRIGEERVTIDVSEVSHQGEGGLLGLALHPDFAENQQIYLYLTTQNGGVISNKVVRYRLDEGVLSDERVIISNILGSRVHDGGRMAFGPDRLLYIATGDAGSPNFAQDINNLAGKILRLDEDGGVPEGNPFGSAVYSFGHRNVQGLAWDNTGRLWATEHGRSGALSGLDELNLIEKGKNYGWPEIQGDEVREGMVSPVVHSGENETWAPAGMIFVNGRLVFTGLRGQSLYVVDLEDDLSITRYLSGVYGRLRGVTLGPDGMLYVWTSNRDGRGSPAVSDDRVIKIYPRSLSGI